ncbi:CaiB/BaiF CoA transferase family protein [Chloroflexota bacterium]
MAGAYNGLKIIDLSDGIAGSYAGTLLAEMGADTIKVEPPQGSTLRGLPGFHVWNRSKRSITIDLQHEGQGDIRHLLTEADVVISDFLPLEARELHLEYSDIASINPQVIYCAMPPLGSRGPHANTPMNDDLVAAYGGFFAAQWAYREGPVYIIIPLASYGAALLAAGAVGAALFARERTGRGQQVEVSWLAGSFASQMSFVVDSETPQESLWERDPLGGFSPAYRLYKASDDWLCIACVHGVFWNKLCFALGMPELISDPRYADAPLGIAIEHRPALKKSFAEAIATRTRSEWVRILQENDVPCAPVMTPFDFINDPQVVHNGMRVEVDDPELGKTIQIGVPVTLSRTPGSILYPAPRLGQHNNEVLNELREGGQPSAISTKSAPKQPQQKATLSGIQVVDFTTYIAGGQVGRTLAEMGADVIKVESIEGDPYRLVPYGFMAQNRGKRDICIDLTSREGQSIINKLVQRADIVVENFRPGVAKRLNMDYETVRNTRPKIIYCSVTGYGSDGPYISLPGLDQLVKAMSGLMQAQGDRQGEPVDLRVGFLDNICALIAIYGTLAALYHRERTGEGQLVEANIISAALLVQSGDLIFYEGKPPGPEGGVDLIGLSALRRLYQAKDGWLMLSIQKNEQWPSFAQAINRSDLDKLYSAQKALSSSRDGELARILEKVFCTRSVDEWLQLFNAAEIPCSPVLSYRDLYKDPHVEANELFAIEDNPEWGRVWVTDSLAKFPNMPGKVQYGTPCLGEHSDEIMLELGYNQPQIQDLKVRKIML